MSGKSGFDTIEEDNGGPESPVIGRMRKLLAKAESTDSEAEKLALLERVAEMSAKYGADTAQAGSKDDEMGVKEYEVIGDFTDMQAELIYWVMEALGCKCVLTFEGVTVVGYVPDIARGDVIVTSLALAMNSGAVRVNGTDGVVRGWMKGFIDTVRQRLRVAEARARRFADQDKLRERAGRLAEEFAEEFPNTTSRRQHFDRSGYAGGANAGRSADIGQSRFGQSRREIA